MNSILKSLRNVFAGGQRETGDSDRKKESPPETPALDSGERSAPSPAAPKPAGRTLIHAPVLASGSAPQATDEILIKAEPSALNDQCKFMVNRDLFAGYSWMFADFESAAGSPLAEAVFSVDGVESVLVQESTLTLTRQDKSQMDWRPLAEEVGAVIRRVLQTGSPLIAEKIVQGMPSEEAIRNGIQEVIDREVNPGVAAHGGRIALLGVKGNTVTIQMGGGCQGCSAADLTLKAGIHTAFRKALPVVGAILDETDHTAGLNPYYS